MCKEGEKEKVRVWISSITFFMCVVNNYKWVRSLLFYKSSTSPSVDRSEIRKSAMLEGFRNQRKLLKQSILESLGVTEAIEDKEFESRLDVSPSSLSLTYF